MLRDFRVRTNADFHGTKPLSKRVDHKPEATLRCGHVSIIVVLVDKVKWAAQKLTDINAGVGVSREIPLASHSSPVGAPTRHSLKACIEQMLLPKHILGACHTLLGRLGVSRFYCFLWVRLLSAIACELGGHRRTY